MKYSQFKVVGTVVPTLIILCDQNFQYVKKTY